jgi:DNA-binding NtrC family response regulator
MEMNWSGNIRQLRNVVERLIILCPNISRIDKEQIVEHVLPTNSRSHILRDVFNKFDRKEDLLTYIAQEYETYKSTRK